MPQSHVAYSDDTGFSLYCGNIGLDVIQVPRLPSPEPKLQRHMGSDLPFRSSCRNVVFTHDKETEMSLVVFKTICPCDFQQRMRQTSLSLQDLCPAYSHFSFVFLRVFSSSEFIHQPPFWGCLY